MKRVLSILLIAVALVATTASADAQNLSDNTGKYLRFTWNDSLTASQSVMFPSYESVTLADGATESINANHYHTFASLSTTLTAAYAVTVVAGTDLSIGAKLYVSLKGDGTHAITFVGDGAGAYTAVANKRQCSTLVWDGTDFRLVGTALNE